MTLENLDKRQQSQVFEVLIRVVQHDVQFLSGKLDGGHVVRNPGYQGVDTFIEEGHGVRAETVTPGFRNSDTGR